MLFIGDQTQPLHTQQRDQRHFSIATTTDRPDAVSRRHRLCGRLVVAVTQLLIDRVKHRQLRVGRLGCDSVLVAQVGLPRFERPARVAENGVPGNSRSPSFGENYLTFGVK
ncbi:hypothetical protein [Streptosporangium sp. NPDC002524]|uniref:hypothetical protein n=1 Tax=Streptosporangium sp. NPDC002524 TaxID=3154537 RepID=UPI00331E6853